MVNIRRVPCIIRALDLSTFKLHLLFKALAGKLSALVGPFVWQSRQSSHHGGNRQGGRCAAGRESAQHGTQDSVESVVLKRCACGAGKKGGRCVSAWERNSARNVDRHVGQRQFGEVSEVH